MEVVSLTGLGDCWLPIEVSSLLPTEKPATNTAAPPSRVEYSSLDPVLDGMGWDGTWANSLGLVVFGCGVDDYLLTCLDVCAYL